MLYHSQLIKMAKVPEIEINKDITPIKCNDLVNSKRFRTRDGMIHHLTMNTELLWNYVCLGEVKDANNDVSCKGQTTKITSKLLTKHDEMKHLEIFGGIYSQEEVKAWESYLEQSGYHNLILNQITHRDLFK